MAVNGRASGFYANLVELITERRHIRGVILVACDDLVDGVDNNGIEVLVSDTADKFRDQLVKRNGVTTQVPNDDVLHMVFWPAQRLIDFHETIDAGCRVDFQIHIQHTALFTGETKPGLALCQGNAKFHQQETLTGLGRTGNQHLMTAT